MKKGLLLSGITGERGDVVRGHQKTSSFIEADFADAAFSLLDQTAMATGITLQSAVRQVFS